MNEHDKTPGRCRPRVASGCLFPVRCLGNLFLSAENEAAYARWGYPGWFHYLTAALELSAALLILYSPSRIYGAALGACVMAAAALTTLGHGEYAHGVAPLVVLAVALILLALSWPQKT
ncbi:DoxX family protein [Paracoccus kondratievae]